jgi:hypothetical protein
MSSMPQQRNRNRIQKQRSTGVALIPFQKVVSKNIRRLHAKYIKTIHIAVKKNIHMLRPIKDKLGLKVAGIHCVSRECRKVCVAQTSRSIENRCKEHMRHICRGQPEKSAMAEHRFDTRHNIDFKSISILDKATGYTDSIIKEATEIRLQHKNLTGMVVSLSVGPGSQ